MYFQESKYFDCTCQRCSSPTELGSHFSTLLCQACHDPDGLVTPKDPLNYGSVHFNDSKISKEV